MELNVSVSFFAQGGIHPYFDLALVDNEIPDITDSQDSEYKKALSRLQRTSLDFIEDNQGAIKPRKGSLAEKVEGPDAILGWLNQVALTLPLPSLRTACADERFEPILLSDISDTAASTVCRDRMRTPGYSVDLSMVLL